jgi:hypothetical protein
MGGGRGRGGRLRDDTNFRFILFVLSSSQLEEPLLFSLSRLLFDLLKLRLQLPDLGILFIGEARQRLILQDRLRVHSRQLVAIRAGCFGGPPHILLGLLELECHPEERGGE